MLFVTGGAYQGKLDYVKERFSLNDADIYCCSEKEDPDFSRKCIYHYERYVLWAMRRGEEPLSRFRDDQIVIMDDLNCGVVPIDAEIRAYREAVGRAGCAVTRGADEVVRIFCGLPKVLKRKTVKIWLIRHGMTQAADDHCYCGSMDLPLTKHGKDALKAQKTVLPYPDAFGKKIYTSGMERAKETARILFPGIEFETDPAFDEMDFGDFELRKYTGDLQSDPDFVVWASGDNERNVCPHGESSVMMKCRVLTAFKKVLAEGKDSVIVCHGGPIAAIFSEYVPESGLNYYQIAPKHGEGYCMEFECGKLLKCTPLKECSRNP